MALKEVGGLCPNLVHIMYMKKVKTIGSNKDQQGPQKSIIVSQSGV